VTGLPCRRRRSHRGLRPGYPGRARQRTHVDTLGAEGLLALVCGIVWARPAAWGFPGVIGCIGWGVVLLPAFVMAEAHSAAPLVSLRLFGS
jgi:hypothetical protein